MKRTGAVTLAVAGFLMWSISNVASATVLSPIYNNDDTVTISTLSAWDTTGMDMNGMLVSIAGTSTETVEWLDGVATGDGWSLTMVDSPGGATHLDGSTIWWGLELDVTDVSLRINSLEINAIPGNVVFDVDPRPDSKFGTPGSKNGKAVALGYKDWDNLDSVRISSGFDVQATYSDIVSLGGTIYGDLYGQLTLNFYDIGGEITSFAKDDSLYFVADTDNIHNPVPEPATLLLFGIGIAGVIGYRKK